MQKTVFRFFIDTPGQNGKDEDNGNQRQSSNHHGSFFRNWRGDSPTVGKQRSQVGFGSAQGRKITEIG
jgi:hypothetical protein